MKLKLIDVLESESHLIHFFTTSAVVEMTGREPTVFADFALVRTLDAPDPVAADCPLVSQASAAAAMLAEFTANGEEDEQAPLVATEATLAARSSCSCSSGLAVGSQRPPAPAVVLTFGVPEFMRKSGSAKFSRNE
jgi:hypothetical protein